jgi:hypothetical protein
MHAPMNLITWTALLLAACGGGDETGRPPGHAELFDGNGRPATTASEPRADAALQHLAGLYVSNEQLAWQTLKAQPYTVVIDADAAPQTEAVETMLHNFRWSGADPATAFLSVVAMHGASRRWPAPGPRRGWRRSSCTIPHGLRE